MPRHRSPRGETPGTASSSVVDFPAPSLPAKLPEWSVEPPPAPDGLVPGSRFSDEAWIMAAQMLAQGSTFTQVARMLTCSRTTLWKAYYNATAFRERIWWERRALDREACVRLRSLASVAAEQINRLVTSGDPSTVRWLADRLGLVDQIAAGDRNPASLREAAPDHEAIAAITAQPEADGPAGVFPFTERFDHEPDLGLPPRRPESRFSRQRGPG